MSQGSPQHHIPTAVIVAIAIAGAIILLAIIVNNGR